MNPGNNSTVHAALLTFAVASSFAASAQGQTIAHNTWSSGAPMPTAREGAAAGSLNLKIYVVGGATDTGIVNVTEIYDPDKDSWKTGSPMPTARWLAASAVAHDLLYVIGGCAIGCGSSPASTLSVVEAYDPTTKTWTTKAPLPVPTYGMSAITRDGIIYGIGGVVGTGTQVSTVYRYDPSTDVWTQVSSMNGPRNTPALGHVDNTIVVSGGFPFADNEGYSVSGDKWRTLTTDPTYRSAPCSTGINGQLYVAGGSGDGNAILNLVEAYDLKMNSWATLAPMPQAVVFQSSVRHHGRLYCFGGSNGANLFVGTSFNYVQIYQP